MTDEASKNQPRKAWLVAGLAAIVAGGTAAVVFAVVWFRHTAGDCGVVRFYEHAFGVIVLGAWGIGTGVGGSLMVAGRRAPTIGAVGSAVAVMTGLAMVLTCITTIHEIREADYSLKSTEQLLGFLAGNDLDRRKLAAHALGERRAAEAILQLCTILDDAQADINLRHNAAIALGEICAPPRMEDVDLDRAVASLVGALAYRDEYLPCSIAGALGRIGDARAAAALGDLLADHSRPSTAREDALRALVRIGGREARSAMEKARETCDDDRLRQSIDAALRMREDAER